MTPNDSAVLVARAAASAPMLREQAAVNEASRHLSPETFDAMSEPNVFRMTAPKRFGGFDFMTQCEVLAEIARGCGSSSWVATIFSAMSWLAGTLPDEAQEDIFESQDPRTSGVFSPTGKAVRKSGGFVVNGRWGFNTGGDGSNWTVINVVAPNAAGIELPTCMLVPSRDLERLDDWHASGMAATGSGPIVAKDLIVPEHRTCDLPTMIEAQYPQRRNSANPYYGYPLAAVLTVNAAGTPVGIAPPRSRRFASGCRGGRSPTRRTRTRPKRRSHTCRSAKLR